MGSVLSRPAIAPFSATAWKQESTDFQPRYLTLGAPKSSHKTKVHSARSIAQIAVCWNSAEPCLQLEFEAAWNTWITRVPTESNIADNPSRFDVTSLIQSGCVKFPLTTVRCCKSCRTEIGEALRPDLPTPCCQKCACALLFLS